LLPGAHTVLTGAGIALVVLVAGLLGGCGAKPRPPAETQLTVEVVVASDVNPDRSGRPSPVALSVLQLKTADAFLNADFFAAADPASPVLAADVVGREEITVQPGETRTWPVKVNAAATRIGVVAAFRDIEKAAWRGEVALPVHPEDASGPQPVHLVIRVEGVRVAIEVGTP